MLSRQPTPPDLKIIEQAIQGDLLARQKVREWTIASREHCIEWKLHWQKLIDILEGADDHWEINALRLEAISQIQNYEKKIKGTDFLMLKVESWG